MGSSILPLIALVILVCSGASALKCYNCVYATGEDLTVVINSTFVTAACASGTGIPNSYEQECTGELPSIHVIRQIVNAASPEIAKSVNAILDQLSAKLAKKPKQAENYACATLDVSVKLNLGETVDLGDVTARTCITKQAGASNVCQRQTGRQLVNDIKAISPGSEDAIEAGVAEISKVWTNFLSSSIGVCVCDTDLCVEKATGGGGAIKVFAPLTLISAVLTMILFHN